MKVLVLSHMVPWPPVDGGRIRTLELARGLAANHEVHVLALSRASDDDGEALSQLRRHRIVAEVVPFDRSAVATAARSVIRGESLFRARYASREFESAVRRRLAATDYDIVQVESTYLAPERLRQGREARPRWILDEHNIEHRLVAALASVDRGALALPYGLYAHRELRLRRGEEFAACRAMDRVLAVSETDAGHLGQSLPDISIDVVPNGVDLSRYAWSLPRAGDHPTIVFVGKMDYRPNVEGVAWFCSEVLPLLRAEFPSLTFEIVGRNPTSAVRALDSVEGVRVIGAVEDTRPYVRNALAVVVPLLAGSGTRLKVLEALAMGQAIVSTSVGAEGIDVIPGKHLLIADGAGSFAQAVRVLIADRFRAEQIGRDGRTLVEKKYGWPSIVSRLDAIYHELLPK